MIDNGAIVGGYTDCVPINLCCNTTPTPTSTKVLVTPTPTPTSTVTPTVTSSEGITPTPTSTKVSVTPTPTPTSTVTPTVTSSEGTTPTPSVTQTETPTNTPTVTPTISESPTPTITSTPTPTSTPCSCIEFTATNDSENDEVVQYTDCDGNLSNITIGPFELEVFCGCNVIFTPAPVKIYQGRLCIPTTPSSTPTQTPTTTPTSTSPPPTPTPSPTACNPFSGGTITNTVLDTPDYSIGYVQFGYIDNGTQIATGASIKGSQQTPTLGGSLSGGTECETDGYVYVYSDSFTLNPNGVATVITVNLNGTFLGQVQGPFQGTGLPANFDTFSYTRVPGNSIEVFWDSITSGPTPTQTETPTSTPTPSITPSSTPTPCFECTYLYTGITASCGESISYTDCSGVVQQILPPSPADTWTNGDTGNLFTILLPTSNCTPNGFSFSCLG